jgi:hypothetical protein
MLLVLVCAPTAWAQEPDIVAEPLCFVVVNTAPWNVYGDFSTDYYTTPDGIRARHRSNFRLKAPGAQGGADRAEFCSYGPFLPGRKLHLTLRTLVPLFSCRTRVDAGPIVIKGERDADGNAKTWAECYE